MVSPADGSRFPSATVVIPTYNRLPTLRRVVEAVRGQRVPEDLRFDAVVVDDGSSDGTWSWLVAQQDDGLTALRQENAGPARARNRGVHQATGEIVLFLGDDTTPSPHWLLEHLEEHRLHGGDHRLAVIGYTGFPTQDDTPFARWINEHGAQFGYLLIDRPRDVPFNFLYTSNLSLPRRPLLAQGGFREDFPAAAWEDIELAYRLCADGLRIVYQPRARTVHRHRVRPWTFCRRQRTSGRSAAIFARLHPELSDFLAVPQGREFRRRTGARTTALALSVELADLLRIQLPDGMYRRLIDRAYLAGLAEGLHRAGAEEDRSCT